MFERLKQYYKTLLPKLSDEEWDVISKYITIRKISKGEHLLRPGEICRHVSFISYGLLRLYYIQDGLEVSTGFVSENEYISEYASFLNQQSAVSGIDAIEDAELWELHYNDVQKLYDQSPMFDRFGRKIAEHIFMEVSEQITSMLIYSPEQRYKWLLDTKPFILQRVPQYMVASLIGISPEHLSRLRKKMMTTHSK